MALTFKITYFGSPFFRILVAPQLRQFPEIEMIMDPVTVD